MNSRIPNVWVFQESWSNKADLSSAQRYGTIRPILAQRDAPSSTPGPCLVKIRHALADYQAGDYLCYTLADPASILLVASVIFDMGLHRMAPLRWLRWERDRNIEGQRMAGAGFYVPSEIHF